MGLAFHFARRNKLIIPWTVPSQPTSGPFANGTDLHLQSYPLIVFPSATTALTETYAHGCGYHSNTEAAAWGRYLDFWDKRAGLWRITKRTYVQDGGVTRIPVSGDAVRLPRLAHLLLPRLRPKSDIQSLSMLQLQQTALQQFYRSLSRMDRGQIPSLLGFQKGTKMAHAAHGETVEIEAGGTVQVHALVRAIGVVEDTREIRSGYVSMRMGLDEEDRLVLMWVPWVISNWWHTDPIPQVSLGCQPCESCGKARTNRTTGDRAGHNGRFGSHFLVFRLGSAQFV